MTTRGLRGAIQAAADEADSIYDATEQLLQALLEANPALRGEDVASIFFTVTEDLRSAYPALAARRMGWVEVPLLCATEIPVPGGLERCVRVLVHWNTELPQSAIQHVYLGAASRLRPDLQTPVKTGQTDRIFEEEKC